MIKYIRQKKYKVISKLNECESIVQEMLVKEDQELPSGVNEVVTTSSLKDEYLMTWEEKRLADIKTKIAKETLHNEKILNELTAKHNDQYQEVQQRLSYLRSVVKHIPDNVFDRLSDFLEGNINYLVVLEYTTPKLLPFSSKCEGGRDKMKLLSLFGDDKGNMQYGINRYRDGSSYDWSTILSTHKSYEDGVKELKRLYSEISPDEANSTMVDSALKHGFELSESQMRTVNEKIKRSIQQNLNELDKKREELLKKLEVL